MVNIIPDTGQNGEDHPTLDNNVFKMTFMTESLQELADESCDEAPPITQSDQAIFDKLWQIDDMYRAFAGCVTKDIQAMDDAMKACDETAICRTRPVLLGHSCSLQNQLEELVAIDTLGDRAHEVWKAALQNSIEDLLGVLRTTGYTDISEAFRITDPKMNVIDTSAYFHTDAFLL